jgi:hypothetical protein
MDESCLLPLLEFREPRTRYEENGRLRAGTGTNGFARQLAMGHPIGAGALNRRGSWMFGSGGQGVFRGRSGRSCPERLQPKDARIL